MKLGRAVSLLLLGAVIGTLVTLQLQPNRNVVLAKTSEIKKNTNAPGPNSNNKQRVLYLDANHLDVGSKVPGVGIGKCLGFTPCKAYSTYKIEYQTQNIPVGWQDQLLNGALSDAHSFEVYTSKGVDDIKTDLQTKIDNITTDKTGSLDVKIQAAEDRLTALIKEKVDGLPTKLLASYTKDELKKDVMTDLEKQIKTLEARVSELEKKP